MAGRACMWAHARLGAGACARVCGRVCVHACTGAACAETSCLPPGVGQLGSWQARFPQKLADLLTHALACQPALTARTIGCFWHGWDLGLCGLWPRVAPLARVHTHARTHARTIALTRTHNCAHTIAHTIARAQYDEWDNAANTMMAHSPSAWEHVLFKDVSIKVSNVEVRFHIIHMYVWLSLIGYTHAFVNASVGARAVQGRVHQSVQRGGACHFHMSHMLCVVCVCVCV